MHMAFSKNDLELRAQVLNFSTVLAASPSTYNQTSTVATSVTTVVDAFIDALDALTAARANGVRSTPLVETKNSTRLTMLNALRPIYAYIQDSLVISDSAKSAIGVHIKKTTPSDVPVPSEEPSIDILSVKGRTVTIRLHGEDSTKRAKPEGCSLANVYSFVGDVAPSDPALWRFEGCTGKVDEISIVFPATVEAGSQVWFVAQWLNAKGQLGPGCDAVGTTLAGGSTTVTAMKMAA
jgi:hypothetical protein